MAESFPLSRTKWINGTRRLAREKVLQFLAAYTVSKTSDKESFEHIFNRKFNFSEDTEEEITRLLTPDEIYELEADIPIIWKEEDVLFARTMILRIRDNETLLDNYIRDFVENWELERIALLDRLLMQMALAEMLYFEDIPVKVSVNEAIDIAKKYSTEKSSQFINGILDTMLIKLIEDGKINKSGRGLIED